MLSVIKFIKLIAILESVIELGFISFKCSYT